MTTINLREHYPELYSEDAFLEVSDDIAAFLAEDNRLQINYAQYIRDNRAFYSLDAGDGIENSAIHRPEQPDEVMLRQERDALIHAALASLPDKQRRRIYQCVVEGKRKITVAQAEHVTEKAIRKSIRRGLAATKIFLKKFGF